MKAYSMDLRQKIVEAVSTGTPKAQVARTFGVSLSTVKRYAGRAERGEDLTPRKPPGKRRKVDGTAQRLLERDLEERPSATLPERGQLLARVAGVEVSDSTVSRTLKRMGFSRKKIGGSDRTRRVLESSLAHHGRRGHRDRSFGLRGRVRREHLPGAAVRLVEARGAGVRQGAT
jgi:transposase